MTKKRRKHPEYDEPQSVYQEGVDPRDALRKMLNTPRPGPRDDGDRVNTDMEFEDAVKLMLDTDLREPEGEVAEE